MRIARVCFAIVATITLGIGSSAAAVPVDFDFSIRYSGSSITGRLVGLNLDATGNAAEVDPSSVLIFTAPAIVGLPASPSNPYVFVPHTFERSTYFSGTFISTTPGVYGFQVSNYTMSPPSQNLFMIDASNDVTLVFNFGAGLCGECGVATYGIQAEEDALWPAINSFVSFKAVALPGDFNNNGVVDSADYVSWRRNSGSAADYSLWRSSFGAPGSGGSLSGLGTSQIAPEPEAFALMMIAMVAILGRAIPSRGGRP